MENKAHERCQWLWQQVEQDPEFLDLYEQLRQAQPDFQTAMEALPPQLREYVTEYLGILADMNNRITEICCYAP